MRHTHSTDELGERLKAVRLQKGLLQKDVAEQAQIHPIQYGRYERGDSKPTADVLARLADALGVSGDYLLGDAVRSKARFHDAELLDLFHEVEKFPDEEKRAVKHVLDAFVMRRKMLNLTASAG